MKVPFPYMLYSIHDLWSYENTLNHCVQVLKNHVIWTEKKDMEQTSVDAWKDLRSKIGSFCDRNKDEENLENGDLGLSKYSISRGLNKKLMLPHALYLKLKQSRISRSYVHDSAFNCNIGLDYQVPKCMVTIDEKYIRRCLELIQTSASKAARCNESISLSSVKTSALTESLSVDKLRTRGMGHMERFIITCPSASEDGNTVVSSNKMWFVGSIMGSKSMINILKSPLLHQLGITEETSNLIRMDLNDIKGFTGSNLMDSPGGVEISSLKNLNNAKPESHQDESDAANERFFSTPSRNSLCSDQSSSGSASTLLCQGMLQFTWKDGNPYFIFSVDDEKEVYVASSSKVTSANNNALDYVYLFCSAKSGLKDHEVRNSRPCIVGKMTVSTSYGVCPNNSKIADTEFVLFGGIENSDLEINPSNTVLKKNKVFPRKVAEVFRTSNSSKQRSTPNLNRSGAMKDSCPWEPNSDKLNSSDDLVCARDLPPNLELAAIVVRDHLPEDRGSRVGGWGLKFLKQAKAKQRNNSLDTSVQADCCVRNSGKCSTSMDILIPAGLHGGPRTRNGGPSTLKERWKSGGVCDCGGWDIGCPLTILEGQSVNDDTLRQADMQECRAFNIHAKGYENGPPTLRMVNIREGLYFVHFQPKLSSLQCFSIAVAIVHSRSPGLKPRNVQELK
ncbi:uncharacterized protein E5676_scaffold434G001990 [Cucumis melo var. makuwa]|uniref:DUF3527 domain protein n=1 Tax=Cucumis melo var. makuwa TaxID=1194695 RepID=A0A5D3D256_CUCMM|nr:uncharacterized protein E5676_scaffold434G001990 [Cucumis melo var. makuwa]